MADNIIRVEETKHSKLGASSAYRWMNCPGSVALNDKAYKDGSARSSGPAAAEGTAAHTIGAAALLEGSEPWNYTSLEVEVEDWIFPVDPEMVEAVSVWTDFVDALVDQYKDENPKVFIEHSMQSKLNDLAFGTSDTLILVPGEVLIVIDYKHGKGVVVEPDSTQNKYYGALACEVFPAKDLKGIKRIEMYIVQPRIPHPKGVVRGYESTPTKIKNWFKKEVLPAMDLTQSEDAMLATGEWCRFCSAKDTCPAIKKEVANFNVTLDPDYIDGDALGELLSKKKIIVDYFKTLESEAYRRVMDGQDVKGYKLVRGKSNRAWKDDVEDKIKDKFGDEAYQERKVKSPAMLEKLEGGKTFVSEFAYKPDTGLTIAPTSDKREAVKRPMDAFLDQLDD